MRFRPSFRKISQIHVSPDRVQAFPDSECDSSYLPVLGGLSLSIADLRSSVPEWSDDHRAHSVQFYGNDTFLISDLSQFIGSALESGCSSVVIATEAHKEALADQLAKRGIDLLALAADGRYQALEASALLARFTVDGHIDGARFFEVVGEIIGRASAASRHPQHRVVAFGEMVALLWADGKAEAAIRLEKLWNGLAKTHSFSLRCAYPLEEFSQEEDALPLSRICDEHSLVIPEESTNALGSEKEQLRELLRLQQKARALQSEVELRHHEERFKLFVEAVQDYAIFILDPQGRVISWNMGAERIKGYRASEIIGQHFSSFYPAEEIAAGRPQALLDAAARLGRSEDEGWRVRKNGERFWARVTLTAIRDTQGALIGFGKVTRDLTEQKQSDSAIRIQEQRFHMFVQSVQDYAMFMLDPDGNVMTWNLGAERIKGYKAADIVGQHFSCFYPPDIRHTKPMYELEVAAKEGRFEDEGWRLRKDGSKFWANVIITALKDEAGHLIGFGKVTRDLTSRMLAEKLLEESEHKLRDSEKSLRELSLHLLRTQDEERRRIGRDIHDSLGQYLSVLKMRLESMNPPSGVSEEIAECANLVGECVKEVRTISYLLYPPMLEELGLTSAIPWYLEGFSQRSGIKTAFEAPADFGRLARDTELVLFRVLQESLTNIQRHSGSTTAEIRISRDGSTVTMEVADQGKGMSPGTVERGSQSWASSLGVGLRGMAERLSQINGTLDVFSDRNGTKVRASVFVHKSAAADAASD